VTRHSKGFAFVEMAEVIFAWQAISNSKGVFSEILFSTEVGRNRDDDATENRFAEQETG
jgi:hypothetical protein